MGTRSLTIVIDENVKPPQEMMVMYRQFDGYPSAHGMELEEFFKGRKVINGFGGKEDERHFNGASCLSAQLVKHFKEGIGGIYLYPANTRDMWEEWIYRIHVEKKGTIRIEVEEVHAHKTYQSVEDALASERSE